MIVTREHLRTAALGLVAVVALGALANLGPLGGLATIAGRLALLAVIAACLCGVVANVMSDRAHASRGVAIAGRALTVAAVLAVLWDPARNGPDLVLTAIGGLLLPVPVLPVSLGGIVVAALVVTALFGTSGSPSGDRRATVRQGSSVGPVAAFALSLLGRGLIGLVALALAVVIATAAWVMGGVTGLREAMSGGGSLGRAYGAVAAGRSASGTRFGLLTSGWGRSRTHDVWIRPAWLGRDAAGELVAEQRLEPRSSAASVTELAELVNGILVACDVALPSVAARPRGGGDGDPRSQTPKLPAYRLEVARAWSNPDYHAVVVQAQPALIAAALARSTVDQLIPGLDAHTSWTADILRGLRLSDPRIAADPLRGGERGLFVALDRTVPSTTLAVGLEGAVVRALREAGAAGRFRHQRTEETADAEIALYGAPYATATEWRELEELWKNLQPAVALWCRDPSVKTTARLGQGFVASRQLPEAAFPSGEATRLRSILSTYGEHLRTNRSSFVVGLDAGGVPVYATFGDETPHLLVAGGTGSGKSVLVRAALAQLLVSNTPAQLRVTLLDSVKRELVAAFSDDPHIVEQVVADDGDAVVRTLSRFVDSMDATYRRAAGRRLEKTAPMHLLVLEEWADLQGLLLSRTQSEEVVRLVARIGQLGRGARHHLCLVTQKASASVLDPRIKASLRGRIAGSLPDASDYGILFDRHRQLVPNVKGRFAVSLDGGEPRLVQGVYADDASLRAVLRQPAPPPTDAWTPTQGEIDQMAPLTAARILLQVQIAERVPLVISVRGFADRVRSLGYQPGRIEKYTGTLAHLEERGVLRRVGDGPTSSRVLAVTDLELLEQLLG